MSESVVTMLDLKWNGEQIFLKGRILQGLSKNFSAELSTSSVGCPGDWNAA